ncbi:hypothetical protein ACTID9_02560 [Brevibacillus fluminis]
MALLVAKFFRFFQPAATRPTSDSLYTVESLFLICGNRIEVLDPYF